jgi:glycogen debranching enzyme
LDRRQNRHQAADRACAAGPGRKDKYTDRFGDGFYDYQSRSRQGNRNQGWKDLGDAIVYEDGRQVDPPISTCEEQAFVYVAKLRMSEILSIMGDRDLARKMFHDASELKKRFNDRFWMNDKKFFALGLDSKRQQIKSISSNPGHLLACGIVDTNLAAPVARRLLEEDMFTGWGVRTLSAEHPAYDPYSYHRGSVWPVEHGTFAMGMMRFGLIDELHTIARGMFEVSSLSTTIACLSVSAGTRATRRIRSRRCTPKRIGPRRGRLPVYFLSCKPCWASILTHP